MGTRLGDVAAPLAIHDAQVYAGTVDGWFVALSTAGGERIWRTQLGGGVRAAPVAVGGGVIAATGADSLYLLARATGAIRARRGTDGTVLAAPALADSVVLFGTTGGRVEACDTATLATRWSLDVGSEVVGAIAVRRDTAFVLTHDGDLWRVPLDAARSRVGPDTAVQGNLDPALCLGTWAVAEAETREVLARAGTAPGHVFNLGHGVLPETDPAILERVVALVHAEGRAGVVPA